MYMRETKVGEMSSFSGGQEASEQGRVDSNPGPPAPTPVRMHFIYPVLFSSPSLPPFMKK